MSRIDLQWIINNKYVVCTYTNKWFNIPICSIVTKTKKYQMATRLRHCNKYRVVSYLYMQKAEHVSWGEGMDWSIRQTVFRNSQVIQTQLVTWIEKYMYNIQYYMEDTDFRSNRKIGRGSFQ